MTDESHSVGNFRNVLIVTGGQTPQVVTETVWALARRPDNPFFPDRIVCVVTGAVAARFYGELTAALDQLAEQWNLQPRWGKPEVAIPLFADGTPVNDVRDHAGSVLFADFITELVRRETADPRVRLHLSLAGGRKTMSYHAGAAMGLWGRPQDELSHVLVGIRPDAALREPPLQAEEFERSNGFWFPTPRDCEIPGGNGRMVNAREAVIDLSDVPFVSVRDLLPSSMVGERLSHETWVRRFREAVAGRLVLHLTTAERQVRIGDLADFKLPPIEFALYQLMAEWAQQEIRGGGPGGIGPAHAGWLTMAMITHPEMVPMVNPIERLIEIYTSTCVEGSDKGEQMSYNITPRPENDTQRKNNGIYLATPLSRLRKRIAKELGHHLMVCERFSPPAMTSKKGNAFGLRLRPEEIVIVADRR